MLRVVAWLWHDSDYRFNYLFKYGREHVERLFASVNRNLTLEHENVLITDHITEYANVDRVIPLWQDFRHLPGWRGKGHGCWHRLKAFDRDTALEIGERFVWLDIDCVITGELDSVFSRTEDFVALRDANPPTPYCGSMIMMDAGCRQRVWDEFNADPDAAMKKARGLIGTDQAWMGRMLKDEAVWDTSHGVYNFRHDMGETLPKDARIVFFTGPRDPSQTALQKQHPWIIRYWSTTSS